MSRAQADLDTAIIWRRRNTDRPLLLENGPATRRHAKERAVLRWTLSFVLGLALLGPQSVRAGEVAGRAPVIHTLGWERLGVWPGYRLNGHRIAAAFVSEPVAHAGEDLPLTELVEFDVVGPEHRSTVYCSFEYPPEGTFTAACDFVPADGGEPAVFVLGTNLRGTVRRGATSLEVSADFFNNLEELQLRFSRPNGERVAAWAATPTAPRDLTTWAGTPAEHELSTFAALASLFVRSGGAAAQPVLGQRELSHVLSPRLDSFPVSERGARDLTEQAVVLSELEQQGEPERAFVLRRHLAETRGIDRRAGALIERDAWTARFAMGLQGGVVFSPDPGGAPQPSPGARVAAFGGVRTQRFLFGISLGMQQAVDARSFGSSLGIEVLSSMAFALALEARYALPLGSRLEGVVGLSVLGAWRNVEGRTVTATQVGLVIGPIVGLQALIWKMNDLGSRTLVALEGIPEWGFWASPSVSGPSAAERASMGRALSDTDLAVRLQLSLRIEL